MERTEKKIPVRHAVIGKDTNIRRALPTGMKKTIGAWCFLDHIGPVDFTPDNGLDVGPHPHTGLQTFTWMLQGEIMHTDSLGYKQLIRPKQVNLMTAGHGISHTETSPSNFAGQVEAVQLWLAQPEATRHGSANFQHYPEIPEVEKDNVRFSILVGDFLDIHSPVEVATPLLGVDIQAPAPATTTLKLREDFEYGVLLLRGNTRLNGEELDNDHMIYYPAGSQKELFLETLSADTHLILLGGEPFEAPVIIWWNLVVRKPEEIQEAIAQWKAEDPRFGTIPDYPGKRLTPAEPPARLIASN